MQRRRAIALGRVDVGMRLQQRRDGLPVAALYRVGEQGFLAGGGEAGNAKERGEPQPAQASHPHGRSSYSPRILLCRAPTSRLFLSGRDLPLLTGHPGHRTAGADGLAEICRVTHRLLRIRPRNRTTVHRRDRRCRECHANE